MTRYLVVEHVEYTVDADSDADAHDLAVNWPEDHPSYRLVDIRRDIVELATRRPVDCD